MDTKKYHVHCIGNNEYRIKVLDMHKCPNIAVGCYCKVFDSFYDAKNHIIRVLTSEIIMLHTQIDNLKFLSEEDLELDNWEVKE